MTRTPRLLRFRVLVLAAVMAASGFVVEATPVPLPQPLADLLATPQALALYCASNPDFTGRLTGSSGSTTALARTTSSTAYGYISNVGATWSCTAYYRYSSIAWNTSATTGTFVWGNLINSTSVSCNFVVGSTDYLKANTTTDCPDTDAEYALSVSLAQGVYSRDVAHNSTGDFSYAHADCLNYYGTVTQTGQTFATSNANNRPGANCDPITLDDTATAQTVTVDSTNPTTTISAPTSGGPHKRNYTTYQPIWTATDNVAGFGGAYLWSMQRQTAPVTAVSTCGTTWTNDGSPVTGTAQTQQTGTSVSLTNLTCYRWVLTAEDQNGNGPVSLTSGTMLIDRTASVVDFTAPNEATTTTVNATAYSVAWTDSDAHSGIATRSLQRQRVASATSACTGTFANDGSPVTTASPSSQTLTDGYCYQWIQTVIDGAGNSTARTSGKVWVSISSPSANFTSPNEGTITPTASVTSPTISWTETAPTPNTITSRSLQRQRIAAASSSMCTTGTWSNDGTAYTGASPRTDPITMTTGYCYRWALTLTNSGGKSSTSYSGVLLADPVAPTASISTPAANTPLAGSVTISGSVADSLTFKDYTLDYGAGTSPSSWTSIASGTDPVTNAALGTWAPGSLSGVYTIRLTARDDANNAVSTLRTVVLENAKRGDEAFFARTPFDLGGGWMLDVGAANGEARLSRDLFSIPSYGPGQALGLSYSSLETSTAGRFGAGWHSNLTQYLTFDATDIVVWHRADGGRVPFGKVAGVWTPLAGHFETLSLSGSEYTVTLKDQTKLVFDSTGAGRLKRIENRFGDALTMSWSTNSATATDDSGRATTLTIDGANNRITGVTDSAGRSWSFGYTGTSLMGMIT